jgi:membrane protease YdiL (CAAX protease family)
MLAAARHRRRSRIDIEERNGPIDVTATADRKRSMLRHLRGIDRLLAPLLLFAGFYVATLIALTWLRFPLIQWTGLICVTVATLAVVILWERGRWQLGLFVPPRRALPEFLFGTIWGFLLILGCAAIIMAVTDVTHAPGTGFPWRELVLVFVPAAVHEELLFRGYAFQKLHQRSRVFAIVFLAAVFAALHSGNEAVTALGLTNIFLGGVLLGLAWERYRRLWFPIGLHLAWNLATGPLLGHEVSGYESLQTLFVERGTGPEILTGGEFGIEGSVIMTATELVAIWLLRRAPARVDRASSPEAE